MIDVLIQTFNEALNLPRTLASLAGWTNRIFVDSGSTDDTAAIARAAGAIVIEHPWEGYARQKNWAIDNVDWQSPWILIVDGDEEVTPSLRDELVALTHRPVESVSESAFNINRVLIFTGAEIHYSGYFPAWNIRLFKRGHARYEERLVHEHMIVSGPVGYLKGLLRHEDKRGLEHFIAKHNRYSTLEAREILSGPHGWPGMWAFVSDRMKRRRWLKYSLMPRMPFSWVVRFLYMYILRGGILDGSAGWRLCVFIATYDFFIKLKYQELRRLGGMQLSVSGLSIPEGASDQSPANQPAPAPPIQPSAGEIAEETTAIGHTNKAPVSVIIPTLNEESNLARCLDHLAWADEVFVVDSGSKDSTCAIAEDYGARVVQFHWNGRWPKKKNWALANLPFRNEWVLIVDADEWIMPELADEIRVAIRTDDNVGYYINRRFIFMGGWIRHCGYYPSWNLRLIRKGMGEYERLTDIGNTGSGDNEVHEHVVARGQVGYLNHDMLHFAFPSIHVFMEKHNRYSNWEAAVQFEGMDNEAPHDNADLSRRRWLKRLSRSMPFRPTLRFFYSYIVKGGILDGRPGYVFCRLLAIYEYLSVSKYYELKRGEEDRRSARQLSSVPEMNRPMALTDQAKVQ